MNSKEKEFITYVIKNMVSNPSDVQVVQTVDDIGTLLSITVNKADMARIIGKQGQTAKAIRQVLRVVSFTNNSRVTMKIVDPSEI